MHLKMLSGKWQPFCPSLNVLIIYLYPYQFRDYDAVHISFIGVGGTRLPTLNKPSIYVYLSCGSMPDRPHYLTSICNGKFSIGWTWCWYLIKPHGFSILILSFYLAPISITEFQSNLIKIHFYILTKISLIIMLFHTYQDSCVVLTCTSVIIFWPIFYNSYDDMEFGIQFKAFSGTVIWTSAPDTIRGSFQ